MIKEKKDIFKAKGHNFTNMTKDVIFSAGIEDDFEIVMPDEIAKEIRRIKYHKVGMIFSSILFELLCGYMLGAELLGTQKSNTLWGIPLNYLPDEWVIYGFMLFFLIPIIWTSATYVLFLKQVDEYKKSLSNGQEIIPIFLTNKYKKTYADGVYVNFACWTINILCGICIAIFSLMPQLKNNYWKQLIVLTSWVILAVSLGLQIIVFISNRIFRNNINAKFQKEIVSEESIRFIKKRSWIHLLVVILIVAVVIWLPIMIIKKLVRKDKQESVIPFSRYFKR